MHLINDMGMKSSNYIETTASTENYEKIYSVVEEKLDGNNISREIRAETFLVLEALFHNIRAQGFDERTLLTVKVRKSFGEINIDIGFEGRPFAAVNNGPSNSTPEDDVLKAYEDRFDCSYWNGYNHIHIAVKRSIQHSLFLGLK